MRYLLLKEEACPGCGGDGWILADDDTCPKCEGAGIVRVQVAVVPEPVAEILTAQFGEAIPFQGEPMEPKVITEADEYF